MTDKKISCDTCRDYLDDYRRNELTPELRAQVDAHQLECPRCREALQADEQLGSLIRSSAGAETGDRPDLREIAASARRQLEREAQPVRIVRHAYAGWGIAAALVIFVAAYLYLMPSSTVSVRNRSIASAARPVVVPESQIRSYRPAPRESVESESSVESKDKVAYDKVDTLSPAQNGNMPQEKAPPRTASEPLQRTGLNRQLDQATAPGANLKPAAPAAPPAMAPAATPAAAAADSSNKELKKAEISEFSGRKASAAGATAAEPRQQEIAPGNPPATKVRTFSAAAAAPASAPALVDSYNQAAPISEDLAFATEKRLTGAVAGKAVETFATAEQPVGAAKLERPRVMVRSPQTTVLFKDADRRAEPRAPGAATSVQVLSSASATRADDARLRGDTTAAISMYRQAANGKPSAAAAEAQLRLADLLYDNPATRQGAAREYRRCLLPELSSYYSAETLQEINSRLAKLATEPRTSESSSP